MNAETVWKVVTIPANNVKRMCGIHHLMHHSFFLDFDNKVAFFVIGLQLVRKYKIPLAKWRVLQVLPALILITLWRVEWRDRLHIKQTVVVGLKVDLVDHPAGNNQVVAIFKRYVTQECA